MEIGIDSFVSATAPSGSGLDLEPSHLIRDLLVEIEAADRRNFWIGGCEVAETSVTGAPLVDEGTFVRYGSVVLLTPSFITANFVGRQIGYRMPKGWMQGDDATNAWFAPLPTFAERFDALLSEIEALGYSSIDLWCAHLHWRWATPQHVETARSLLAKRHLAVRSYPAWVMGEVEDLRAACRLCAELAIPFFAGNCALFASDRAAAVAILREFGVGYAIENHPEKASSEIFARLGAGDEDVVGVALDTGWCATAGWDPVQATRDFEGRLMAVHLKDVRAPRTEKTGLEFIDRGHETCRLGDGIARVREVLAELKRQGFGGPIGIEHEPELFDPSADLRESRMRVLSWWKEM